MVEPKDAHPSSDPEPSSTAPPDAGRVAHQRLFVGLAALSLMLAIGLSFAEYLRIGGWAFAWVPFWGLATLAALRFPGDRAFLLGVAPYFVFLVWSLVSDFRSFGGDHGFSLLSLIAHSNAWCTICQLRPEHLRRR